jgi:PHP family Zn ribbon phosphoesterase
VEELADRKEGFVPPDAIPYKNLIPLEDIVADAFGVSSVTKRVLQEYENLIKKYGNEFKILLDIPLQELEKATFPEIAEGIIKTREGKVSIVPGYDGVYGKISVFSEKKDSPSQNQKTLF